MAARSICILLVISPVVLAAVGCASSAARQQAGVRPAAPSPHTERLLKLAERYEQQGNYEGALRIYTQVAKTDPDNPQVRDSIAALSSSAGRSTHQAERGMAAYRSRSRSSQAGSRAGAAGAPPATEDPAIAERAWDESDPSTADQTLPEVQPARSFEWANLSGTEEWTGEEYAEADASEPAWWRATTQTDTDPRPAPVAAWSASAETVDTADWANPGPGALELLTSSRAEDRKAGLEELAEQGDGSEAGVDAVQRLAERDADLLVRAYAASTLWTMTHSAEAPVAALTELLAADNEEVVQVAAYLLGGIGPAAADAIPALRQACDETTGATRIHAVEALARIDLHSHEPVDLLTAALTDHNEETRWLSAIALSGVAPEHRSAAVSALTTALQDPSDEIRSVAALTLGGFGPDARSAVPQLERAALVESEEVRAAAETALACINR